MRKREDTEEGGGERWEHNLQSSKVYETRGGGWGTGGGGGGG